MLEAISHEKNGVAGLEYDVVGTTDATAFLTHDKYIKNGDDSFEIFALKSQELNRLKPDINKLQEAFAELNKQKFSKDFEFHLEIKTPDEKLVITILELLEKYPKIDKQTTIRSFQESVLTQAKKARPDKKYCLLLGGKQEIVDKNNFVTTGKTSVEKLPDLQGIENICGFKPEQVSVQYKLLNEEFILNMHKATIEVEVYTLNDINGIKGLKVDRITSDNPLEIYAQINK